MSVVDQIKQALRDQSDPIKADFFPHFFKAEPGVVDTFLGVTVPKQRVIVKAYYQQITPLQVVDLLHSTMHEERLTALMTWVLQFQKGDSATKKQIYDLYLQNTSWINNWDLVDASCRDIVGAYIFKSPASGMDQSILDTLSQSKNVWERRIAIVATFYFIQQGEFAWTLKLAEQYLDDDHHYIHKATGWMLREVGKRDEQVLTSFLDDHVHQMPRTALRYALERLSNVDKKRYMQVKLAKK